jgi:hypothetical protein
VNVAIIIPLDRSTLDMVGDPFRARAYGYVMRHLAPLGAEIVVGVCDGEWCKATAVADALTRTDADMLVVHDADVVVSLIAIERAVSAVHNDIAKWAIPHNLVHRLDEDATNVVLAGAMPTATRQLVRWPYVGMVGGGIVALRRTTYNDCPLDARFLGWGSEDQSWGFALTTLHHQPWRGDADLFHLFHPHPEPDAQRSPRYESEALRRAYRQYRGWPEQMRPLVDAATIRSTAKEQR